MDRLENAFKDLDLKKFILIAKSELETIQKKLQILYPASNGNLAFAGNLKINGALMQISPYTGT